MNFIYTIFFKKLIEFRFYVIIMFNIIFLSACILNTSNSVSSQENCMKGQIISATIQFIGRIDRIGIIENGENDFPLKHWWVDIMVVDIIKKENLMVLVLKIGY